MLIINIRPKYWQHSNRPLKDLIFVRPHFKKVKKELPTLIFLSRFLSSASFSTFASRAFLFVKKNTHKNRMPFGKLAKELNPASKTNTHIKKNFLPARASWTALCLSTVLFSVDNVTGQIQQSTSPTFQQMGNQTNPTVQTTQQRNTSKNNYSTTNPTSYKFSPNYIAPTVNTQQNSSTQQIVQLYSAIKEDSKTNSKPAKQLWELNLKGFRFANPNSDNYRLKNKYYKSAYDSVNEMLEGNRPLNLKRAVFLVENTYFDNQAKYKQFCDLIAKKVYILRQVIKTENLDTTNNLALNYAIQKLFMESVKYKDKDGTLKNSQPFKYDFEDFEGTEDFTKQFVTKFLINGKGQCHSMPLLYLILANEIGAKANIAYSPNHSYIAFSDNQNNWYNFECTSGEFTSYSFIMSSGYVKAEAIKSGIYTVPVSLKQVIANQLNDLAIQHNAVFGIDDFQLKCAKRTLEFFPNNIMAMMNVSNHQTAKTKVAAYNAGFPNLKDINNYPDLKKELYKMNELYSYIDNLGFSPMPNEAYQQWLKSLDLEKEKQESLEIKKFIIQKIKM
jgi:hypothetical protein